MTRPESSRESDCFGGFDSPSSIQKTSSHDFASEIDSSHGNDLLTTAILLLDTATLWVGNIPEAQVRGLKSVAAQSVLNMFVKNYSGILSVSVRRKVGKRDENKSWALVRSSLLL